MRIGILTYHRSHNYGALLQAYALKEYISSLEKDVCFIDYWPHYHQEMYALWNRCQFRSVSILGKIKMILVYLLLSGKKRKRRRLFERFIAEHIRPVGSVDDTYDLVVYGSDQIWRYQDHYSYKGFNSVYFGDDTIRGRYKISYAASMGGIQLDGQDKLRISGWLSGLDQISVRERDLCEAMSLLTSKAVSLVVDPVFLLPASSYERIMTPRLYAERYILVYNLQCNRMTYRVAERLSQRLNLPIVEISGGVYLFDSGGRKSVVGPSEFLSLIYHADYVVSSSFHGVAFSVLFEKRFYATLERNTGRVRSLLSRIGLENRIVSDCDTLDIEDDLSDMAHAQLLIDYITESKRYLNKCINLDFSK